MNYPPGMSGLNPGQWFDPDIVNKLPVEWKLNLHNEVNPDRRQQLLTFYYQQYLQMMLLSNIMVNQHTPMEGRNGIADMLPQRINIDIVNKFPMEWKQIIHKEQDPDRKRQLVASYYQEYLRMQGQNTMEPQSGPAGAMSYPPGVLQAPTQRINPEIVNKFPMEWKQNLHKEANPDRKRELLHNYYQQYHQMQGLNTMIPQQMTTGATSYHPGVFETPSQRINPEIVNKFPMEWKQNLHKEVNPDRKRELLHNYYQQYLRMQGMSMMGPQHMPTGTVSYIPGAAQFPLQRINPEIVNRFPMEWKKILHKEANPERKRELFFNYYQQYLCNQGQDVKHPPHIPTNETHPPVKTETPPQEIIPEIAEKFPKEWRYKLYNEQNQEKKQQLWDNYYQQYIRIQGSNILSQ